MELLLRQTIKHAPCQLRRVRLFVCLYVLFFTLPGRKRTGGAGERWRKSKSQLATPNPQGLGCPSCVLVTLHKHGVHLPEGAGRVGCGVGHISGRGPILAISGRTTARQKRVEEVETRRGPAPAPRSERLALALCFCGRFDRPCSVGRRRGRAAAACCLGARVPAATSPHAAGRSSLTQPLHRACRRRRFPCAESLSQHHAVARPYARGHAVHPAPGCGHSG